MHDLDSRGSTAAFFVPHAILACLMALAHVSVADAAPNGDVQVIHPTGAFPTDVTNIQDAVDRGGTIILKAVDETGQPTAFNFGSPAHEGSGAEVRLREDVEILGETINNVTTTIRGGWLPFLGFEHTRTVFDGVSFEAQGLSAIVFIRSSGAEITNNRISGVVGTPLPSPPFPANFLEGRGIKFLGNSDPANAITGLVVVSDNVVTDMHADLSDAIVFDAVAADVEIAGNRTEVEQSSGVLMIGGSGSVVIAENDFVVEPGPDVNFGNGIAILGGAAASYRIMRNEILAEDLFAEGIFVLGSEFGAVDRLQLRGNQVTILGSLFGGITLQGDVSNTKAARNRIVGDAAFAFDLLNYSGFADPAFFASPHDNKFTELDVRGFIAGDVDVFLDSDTSHNKLQGYLETVVDLGSDNSVINLDEIPPPTVVPTGAFDLRRDKLAILQAVAKHTEGM